MSITPSVADCFVEADDWAELTEQQLLERMAAPMLAVLREHSGTIATSHQLHWRMTIREVSDEELAELQGITDE